MAVDVRKLNNKIKELQKRYPDNVYVIEEPHIIRKSGRKPHKTKEQQKSRKIAG